jgi:cyclopropane fatty-acyl-phospholipid synthase-like methyltransferase
MNLPQWTKIEAYHKKILTQWIKPHESILDAGCGWGRLLSLLPNGWHGAYTGVDLSPEFIARAKKTWRKRAFLVGDLRDLTGLPIYDWAIMVSMRGMIMTNAPASWEKIRDQLKRHSLRIMYLEANEEDKGVVE